MPIDNTLLEIFDQQKTEGADQGQAGTQYQGSIVDEFRLQITFSNEGAHCVAKDEAAGQKAKAGCTIELDGD